MYLLPIRRKILIGGNLIPPEYIARHQTPRGRTRKEKKKGILNTELVTDEINSNKYTPQTFMAFKAAKPV